MVLPCRPKLQIHLRRLPHEIQFVLGGGNEHEEMYREGLWGVLESEGSEASMILRRLFASLAVHDGRTNSDEAAMLLDTHPLSGSMHAETGTCCEGGCAIR